MNADRRRRVEELFEAALERSPESRVTWLTEACAGDSAVLEDVQAMLAAHDHAGGILDSGPPGLGPGGVTVPQDIAEHAEASYEEAEGAILGPWRLVRELATGGMGRVYLAERADGHFHQRVAIKIIRGTFFSDELYRRFVNERQILATLSHPNIARLFGGGRTEQGRPYLAMEYVDGLPIDEHCQRNRLDLDERLRLFCTVARTVHHAHRNLVVHRDLKPSNILVGPDGSAKLLDFGIAKILDPDALAAVPSPATRTGLRLMTPEYASPEQVMGGAITTATDIYGLGVILYELISGHRPFSGTTELRELERRILEDAPERPSTLVGRLGQAPGEDLPAAAHLEVASPAAPAGLASLAPPPAPGLSERIHYRRLARRLRGDLDRIALMALRKEPDQRYASAEALAEDVERYLAGEPVHAHRDTRRYRVSKFVRRHRFETLVFGASAAMLIVSAIFSATQASRARQALVQQSSALAQSEDVTEFLLSLFEASDPIAAGADTVVARAILRRGLERVDELSGQPLVQAELLTALGKVYYNMALPEESLSMFERALGLRRAELGDDHPRVAESLERVAWLRRGRGDSEAADSMLNAALAILTGEYGPVDVALIETLRGMALLAVDEGRPDSAETLHRRVLAIETAAYGPDDPRLAYNLHRIAGMLRFQHRHQEALEVYREALDLSRRARGPEHAEVAVSMLHLADQLRLMDTAYLAEAEILYREALAMQRRVLGSDYVRSTHGLEGLAGIANDRGRYDEALRFYREALDLRLRVLGPDNVSVAFGRKLFGDQLARLGDWPGSLEVYREVLRIQQRHVGEGTGAALTHHAMGRAWLQLGRPDSAVASLERAEAIWRRQQGSEAEANLASTRQLQAQALLALGQTIEAELALQEARQIYREQGGDGDERLLEVEALLSDLYEDLGRRDPDPGHERPDVAP